MASNSCSLCEGRRYSYNPSTHEQDLCRQCNGTGLATGGQAPRAAPTISVLQTDDVRWRQQVVDYLTIVLEEAKRGEIKSVMILKETDDERFVASWSGFPRLSDRIGQIEVLKMQLVTTSER